MMHDGARAGCNCMHASCIIPRPIVTHPLHFRTSVSELRRNPVLVPGVRAALWPVKLTSQKTVRFQDEGSKMLRKSKGVGALVGVVAKICGEMMSRPIKIR
jgi:hypothetical protein